MAHHQHDIQLQLARLGQQLDTPRGTQWDARRWMLRSEALLLQRNLERLLQAKTKLVQAWLRLQIQSEKLWMQVQDQKLWMQVQSRQTRVR